ncbi:MAG TPA: hypothetical protein VF621_21210, partial [Pyrinomonadaceae bacterium]
MNAKSKILTLLTCCALLLPLCGAGLLPGGRAQAGNGGGKGGDEEPERALFNRDKVSAALRERAGRGNSGKGGGETEQVIIRLNGKMSGGLNSLLSRNGAKVKKELKALGMAVAELPQSAVEELASFEEVSFVSADAETEVLGHVSKATGTDAAAAQTYSTVTKLDGTGVGIAVVDSGIYDQHASFL